MDISPLNSCLVYQSMVQSQKQDFQAHPGSWRQVLSVFSSGVLDDSSGSLASLLAGVHRCRYGALWWTEGSLPQGPETMVQQHCKPKQANLVWIICTHPGLQHVVHFGSGFWSLQLLTIQHLDLQLRNWLLSGKQTMFREIQVLEVLLRASLWNIRIGFS